MKRLLAVLLVLALMLPLLGCSKQRSNVDWGSFSSEKTFSYDKQYYAVQKTADKDDVTYINVEIYTADDVLVASFLPARAWDFWGICWEKDTYNIWVQSGDIGTLCYAYDNAEWTLNASAVRPDYIVSKYD